MTEVAFYHLQQSPLEAALPKLLEKTLAAGHRAVVMAAAVERVEALNTLLWTYHPDSWLPHGSARDGRPAPERCQRLGERPGRIGWCKRKHCIGYRA